MDRVLPILGLEKSSVPLENVFPFFGPFRSAVGFFMPRANGLVLVPHGLGSMVRRVNVSLCLLWMLLSHPVLDAVSAEEAVLTYVDAPYRRP